jgi:hypothetical protein
LYAGLCTEENLPEVMAETRANDPDAEAKKADGAI